MHFIADDLDGGLVERLAGEMIDQLEKRLHAEVLMDAFEVDRRPREDSEASPR